MTLAVPIYVYVNAMLGDKTRACGEEKRRYYDAYISWVYEIISSLRDIRLLGSKMKSSREFIAKHRAMYQVNIKADLLSLFGSKLSHLLISPHN